RGRGAASKPPSGGGPPVARASASGPPRVRTPSRMDDEVAAILDSRANVTDDELARLWDPQVRAGTVEYKDVPALVTRYRERHARNSVDYYIQQIIDKAGGNKPRNPDEANELLGRITEKLRQLADDEPDGFM